MHLINCWRKSMRKEVSQNEVLIKHETDKQKKMYLWKRFANGYSVYYQHRKKTNIAWDHCCWKKPLLI